MICFIPLDSAEPMWQLGIRSARSRWASILASMVSFFMLADEIALILNGLASISGIPADSNASAVFIQWFPVDSQTALHWPYVAFAYAANSDESRDVLLYDDSSRIVPSWLITHVTHFLFPMSIPILFFIFFTSLFLCVASWKLHPSIRAQSPVTQQLGSPHSPARSLRSCMIRGQPATCSGWIRLSCIHQPAHAPRGDHQVHEVQKTEPGSREFPVPGYLRRHQTTMDTHAGSVCHARCSKPSGFRTHARSWTGTRTF